MLHVIGIWALVAAFAGAGLFNAIGTQGTREDFVRWGYPAWWCRVTGALEIAVAAFAAFAATRVAGLVLGGAVICAATATVLRRREFAHLAQLGLFAALIAVVAFTR